MKVDDLHPHIPSYGSAGQTNSTMFQPVYNTTDTYFDVNSTAIPTEHKEKGLDALLYIIIVLLFYAFSIVILMIKYIRREKEEAKLRLYYREFVSRDKFHSPQFENRQYMTKVLNNTKSSHLQSKAATSNNAPTCLVLKQLNMDIEAGPTDYVHQTNLKDESFV